VRPAARKRCASRIGSRASASAFGHGSGSAACRWQGGFPAAIKALEAALPLCQGEFAIYLSRVASSLGVAYAALGRPEGLALLERAVDHARAIGFLFGYSLTLSQLGRGLLLADQRERALTIGSRALEEARQAGEQGNEAWVLRSGTSRRRGAVIGSRRSDTAKLLRWRIAWRWRRYAAWRGYDR
jgi:tetratricopeptide (TPR) repeat protein